MPLVVARTMSPSATYGASLVTVNLRCPLVEVSIEDTTGSAYASAAVVVGGNRPTRSAPTTTPTVLKVNPTGEANPTGPSLYTFRAKCRAAFANPPVSTAEGTRQSAMAVHEAWTRKLRNS